MATIECTEGKIVTTNSFVTRRVTLDEALDVVRNNMG